jgi:cyclohexanecarboxylate-CoA ligase
MTARRWELARPPAEFRERYEAAGFWADSPSIGTIRERLAAHPEQTVVGPEERRSYAAVAEAVDRVAAGLRGLGLGPGDVVSYQLPNRVRTAVVHLAISRLGAVANPIVPIYRRSEVEYILSDAGSRCVIVPGRFDGHDYPAMVDSFADDLPALDHVVVTGADEGRGASVAGATVTRYDDLGPTAGTDHTFPERSPDDLHALLYTSGTTGDPKGVLHTYNTLLAEERSAAARLDLSASSTVFMPSPVTHVTGLCYGLELPFLVGAKAVFMADWQPARALELIEREGCTATMGATPFLKGLTDAAPAGWEGPLESFSCGGAEVPPELVYEATEALGCTVHRMYGLTEFSTVTWPELDAPIGKLAGTDGSPAPGVELRVVDVDSREELPAGETGEILARGPELTVGYTDPAANEAAFENGWFATGDLGVLDDDGYLEITGRLKDIIVRGGENIPVKPVEDRLYEHPAVEEVAVVAMPDPDLQENGCAYVRVTEGESFDFEAMVAHLEAAGIARQKFPERLELVEAFPTNAAGKIRKDLLREDVADKLGLEPVQR